MKKLFTLFAFLAMFMGANAKEFVDLTVDYSQKGTSPVGWKASLIQDDWITADADGLHLNNPEKTTNNYDYQLWIIDGGSRVNLEPDTEYTIKIIAKVSEGSADVYCRIGGWGGGIESTITVNGTEYQEYTFSGKATESNCGLLVQFGHYVGTVSFKSVTITHEGKEERPATWQQWLTDDGTSIIPGQEASATGKYMGDAEFGAWPDWALAKEDGVNINWRGNRTGEICAWSVVRGTNIDPSQEPDPVKDPDGNVIEAGKPRPFPCDIEVDPTNPNNHVFVVHTTAADNQYTDWQAWDNQFFIQSPKSWKTGTVIKVKFRCKAEKAASVQTQIHRQNPSWYLYYVGIGDVDITTEWQEIERTVTFDGNQGTGWSVAFNLNVSNKEPNTFYFDDLSWETMVLEEGFFVASSNTEAGIDYDFDNAIKFEDDPEDDELVTATVGTVGKEDTWVNEIMISTIRGHAGSFKSNTIKPIGIIKGDDQDNWQDYEAASSAKIKLPAAGVWQIWIVKDANEEKQMLFMQLEGDTPAEPVDIVTNTTEFVVNAVEREDHIDSENNGVITVIEEADDPNGEKVGGEGHNGQSWDNQFWIAANRDLEKDEVTVIKFKYKSSLASAHTSTQAHKMGGGKPCTYLDWRALGDVDFTDQWQDFEKEYTVPAEANGMRSFTFNMAEIKGACDYYIKDVQWYIKDDYNAEGKTTENLINAEGTENFYIKIGAGTNPYQYGTDPSGIFDVINDATTRTDVIYNLSGQRVSKDYKGIVIMNGRKVVNK